MNFLWAVCVQFSFFSLTTLRKWKQICIGRRKRGGQGNNLLPPFFRGVTSVETIGGGWVERVLVEHCIVFIKAPWVKLKHAYFFFFLGETRNDGREFFPLKKARQRTKSIQTRFLCVENKKIKVTKKKKYKKKNKQTKNTNGSDCFVKERCDYFARFSHEAKQKKKTKPK